MGPRLHLAACWLAALATAEDSRSIEALSFSAPFEEINTFSGQRSLPGWEVGGSAEVHRSFVRLTAERQGQKGWLTSHIPVAAKEWSAMLEIRASGMSPFLYGDGTQRTRHKQSLAAVLVTALADVTPPHLRPRIVVGHQSRSRGR